MRAPRALDRLPTVDESLQAALQGEYACVYAYGLVGARLEGDGRDRARADMAAHEASRDRLRAELVARSAVPEPAAAAYDPPFPVTSPVSARRLAALVEDRMALVWSDLVGSARAAGDTAVTEQAVAGVAECAVRSSTWSGTTQAFPGLLTGTS